jgi:hypothetical protein
MRLRLWVLLSPATSATASEGINVTFCNQGHVPQAIVDAASFEIRSLFGYAGVEVVSSSCSRLALGEVESREVLFLVRLKSGLPQGSRIDDAISLWHARLFHQRDRAWLLAGINMWMSTMAGWKNWNSLTLVAIKAGFWDLSSFMRLGTASSATDIHVGP